MTQTLTQSINAIEDVPTFQEHQYILQARKFIKGGTDPVDYYAAVVKSLPTLAGTVEYQTAMQLLEDIEMALINLVHSQLKNANEKRAGGETKAIKPVELYRKYAATLRSIMQRNGVNAFFAQDMLTDLYLEQTQSNGDLETPDYMDSYTRETEWRTLDDITAEDVHMNGAQDLIRAIFWDEAADDFDGTAPVLPVSGWDLELQRAAAQCQKDLGWTTEQVQQFLKTNRDGVSMLEEPEEFGEDRNFTPPPLQKDFEIDKELMATSYPVIKAFNQERSRIFDEMSKKVLVEKRGEWRMSKPFIADWQGTFRKSFVQSEAFQAILKVLESMKDEPATAGITYLRVSGEYGVMPEDVAHLRVTGYSTLIEFVSDYFDDLIQMMGDGGLFPTSEISKYDMIDAADEEYLALLETTMPKYDVNPVNTASWNIGFMQAVIAGAEWKQAEVAAWNAWRLAMSIKGAEAFNATLALTSKQNLAMAAFWKECGHEVPRPQQKIKSVAGNKSGLMLENGRFVNWHIAVLKVKSNELDLSGDIKERLVRKLTELQCGRELLAVLQ